MTCILPLSSHRRLGLLLAGIVVFGAALPAQAQEFQKSSPAMLAAFRTVVARPSESTVRVLCDGKDTVLGTVLTEDGWILTKASELKGSPVCKLKDGRSFPARIVGVEDLHDLAMLKIDVKGLRPIEWRESKSAEVGNWLASPGNGPNPVAIGVVSVATRKPIRGELPMSARAQKAGFLGVTLEEAQGAAKIGTISPRSPAAKAGLKVGDIVLKVGGSKVTGPGNMVEAIQRFQPDETVVLEVKRGDEIMEFKATLGKRPTDRGSMQNSMGSKLSDRRDRFPTILQHDQVIKPTDCGGPLVDLDGKAVGINIARAGRVESYAIPTESVLALVNDLKSGKLAPKEPPSPTIAELEQALEKARAELARIESDLKVAEDTRRNAETKKKQLAEQLARVQKKLSEAQSALAKAKNDPTKK
jgi:serine protease Do